VKTTSLRANRVLLINTLEVAETFRERAKGLLGRKSLGVGKGLLIPHCGSVHTFFMQFPLDLIFLDRVSCVCRIVCRVRPFRVVFGGWKARSVVEVESGWLSEASVLENDKWEVC
jgi:uncharacterized membrane protein (UPF0127 family)